MTITLCAEVKHSTAGKQQANTVLVNYVRSSALGQDNIWNIKKKRGGPVLGVAIDE